ncbi:MAG: nitroreductase family protein [Planctomycetes bacterium]|nr:nitroreductase family protein [Planctomycetota bacterium]
MDTLKALGERRSVRSYEDREVDRTLVDRILAAGNHAPNCGPLQFTVITSQELLRQVNDAVRAAPECPGHEFDPDATAADRRPLYGAPVLIVVSAPPEGYYQQNAACAATAMCIAATDLGLGSCYLVPPAFAMEGDGPLVRRLSLPGTYQPVCAVTVGYPAQGYDVKIQNPNAGENVDYY